MRCYARVKKNMKNTHETVLLLVKLMLYFYPPWEFQKFQKSSGFLIFSGGAEREQWHEMR